MLNGFWLVLGAPEALINVEIGLTDAKNLAKKKRNHEENRTSNISFYVFFCDFFDADPRVKIDRGQFSLVSLLASS